MTARLVPRWQIILVLVGFPLLYMLNSFAPWSVRLFGAKDRAAFFPFFISVLTLHWLSVAVTVFFVRKAGLTLADLHLNLSSRKAASIASKLIAVGLLFVVFRQLVPYSATRPGWLVFFPANLSESIFWIPVAISAGFCEELVYRGFGITVLQSRGFRLWQAVLLTTLSFVFMHGPGGIFGFPVFFLAGLLFAGIYLGRVGGVGPRGLIRPTRRRSLLRVMVIHAVGDMTAILLP
ncbi:MAG: CPBP family intramembrane glutamic endopeptidase [Terriglobia bacterium]